MFPDIEYTSSGIDEEQWQVFDSRDGSNVKQFIKRLAEGVKSKWEALYGPLNKSKLPDAADVRYMASILRGDFDCAVSMNVQLHNASEALIALTKEQYRCLDQLDDNPRCLIQGPAGTGKTLLAIEEVKKSVARGEKVALFCFNSNLADWLNSYFSDMPESVRPEFVGTLHKYMTQVAKGADLLPPYPHDPDRIRYYRYNPETCKIRRSTGGTSASLSGVYYECTCGARKNIAGATRPGALSKIGYRCKGSKPWLGMDSDEDHPCGRTDVRVVLRGATNVWFADTRSSIYIPTDDEQVTKKIIAILDEFFDVLSAMRVDGEWNRGFIDMLAERHRVDKNELYNAFIRRDQGLEGLPDITEEISEDEYRLAEYNVLIKSSGGDAQRFHSKNYPISYYDPVISKYFKSISLVHKLQETRAFVGFSRAEPSEMPISERKKMLRLGSENWLPAIQVHGEGIFFEFNKEAVEEWAQRPAVLARLRNLQDSYRNSKFGANVTGDLRPEFVLIHTFAHLIINQLSFECGYGSSSIRERIYCEKAENKYGMYGVLIYTASGDSEGSLGGLVRQGAKDHIEDTIRDAVRNAAWCSSDPVCIQSYGQGPESCNLAACHNCALLPETCCECGNRLLDRGTVVGTLDNKSIGFFAELLEQ